jgi:hypothetical protein
MADVIIGASLQADDQISPKVKSIKELLRDAQKDVVTLSEKFGATSKEAAGAAKRTAELRDSIGDAKSLVDAFNPDTKFKAFGSAINTVVGGFTALTGAMGLLGVEGEGVQKTLVKVQSAMALSQGLASVQEGIQSFKNLKSVLIDTLGKGGAIGLAIAGVAALGIAIYEVFKKSEELTDQQKTLNEINASASKIYANEKQQLDQLVRPLENENTTKKEKLAAIKKLQETYPNYFKNLDLENGKVVGLAEGYAKVVKAIELKARATAAANMLAKQEEQLLELGFKYGITTEADADKFLANLEKTGQTFLIQAANGVKAKREFLKKIQAEAEKGLASAGGDPTGGGSKTGGAAAAEKDVKEISAYDAIVRKAELDVTARRLQAERDKHLRSRELITDQNAFVAKSKVDLSNVLNETDKARTRNETVNAEQRIKLSELEHNQKVQFAQSIGNSLGALADLIGKQTAAGKVLGIAQATINTFIGASEVLRAKSTLPEPFGTIAKIANVTAIIATGLSAVKNIMKVQVPGGAGGGGSVPSVSAPLQAQIPQATTTSLDQRSLNQIGNATTRAFVVESDIANNQERIRRLNRAARLG